MKKIRSLFCLVLVALIIFVSASQAAETYLFEDIVQVKPLPKAHLVELWVPLPLEDPFQRVETLNIKAPKGFLVTQGQEYGNRYLYIRWEGPLLKGAEVKIKARIKRLEASPRPWPYPIAQRYLLPDRLVPVEALRPLAEDIVGSTQDPLAKLKAIYTYVVDNLRYQKSGTGWGRGDALWACSHRHGNCTDFHSLFMALARAEGIPVLFEMGLPVPPQGGQPHGYHCWLLAFVQGKVYGIDASEAAKHPEKRTYFFGHLCAQRILLTRGRDLLLAPPQHGPRINFLYQAYLEVDLKPRPKAVKTIYHIYRK